MGVFLPAAAVQYNAFAGYLPPEFSADASAYPSNCALAARYLETEW
jgi:hypothetical protein